MTSGSSRRVGSFTVPDVAGAGSIGIVALSAIPRSNNDRIRKRGWTLQTIGVRLILSVHSLSDALE